MALMLAGEMTAWSTGAAATDNVGTDKEREGGNGNGVEEFEGRPAPVTDRTEWEPVIGFTERICAKASAGTVAEIRSKETRSRTVRMVG